MIMHFLLIQTIFKIRKFRSKIQLKWYFDLKLWKYIIICLNENVKKKVTKET